MRSKGFLGGSDIWLIVAVVVGLGWASTLSATSNAVSEETAPNSAASTEIEIEIERPHRRLQQTQTCPVTPIAGYLPLRQVQDQANIEKDMQTIAEQLYLSSETGTDDGLDAAMRIYSQGAHSKPFATVVLTTPLEQDFPKGTKVVGMSPTGSRVDGKVWGDYFAGDTSIDIEYETACSVEKCQVGANPIPVLDGCFIDEGYIQIEGLSPTYVYNPRQDNKNARTIESFSTSAESEMYTCTSCPNSMYERFYNYYGKFEYADELVKAAYNGAFTNFVNFNQDFGLYGLGGRNEIIRTAMVFVVIWMKVDERMEASLAACENNNNNNNNNNEDPVLAWDEAWAYYAGILEAGDGSGTGEFLYAHADRQCQNFNTCGETADSNRGTSSVNTFMLRWFERGQVLVSQGNCAIARVNKASIEPLMIIPLIQGTLLSAWKRDNEPYSEKINAEGVGYAMSVVPIVHNCDVDAAETIVGNMGAGDETDYAQVKAAFESTYDCLGILSSEVGSYVQDPLSSVPDAGSPANTPSSTPSSTPSDIPSGTPSDIPPLSPSGSPSATSGVATPAPSEAMPGVSAAPVTNNSPKEPLVPTEVSPTQAPKPVPFTFEDLILGPTQAQTRHVARNIRRPGLGNRLPN